MRRSARPCVHSNYGDRRYTTHRSCSSASTVSLWAHSFCESFLLDLDRLSAYARDTRRQASAGSLWACPRCSLGRRSEAPHSRIKCQCKQANSRLIGAPAGPSEPPGLHPLPQEESAAPSVQDGGGERVIESETPHDENPEARSAETLGESGVVDTSVETTTGVNLKEVARKLSEADKTTREKLILQIHNKFWHAPPSRLVELLRAAGCKKDVLDLVNPVISSKCVRCASLKRPAPRPLVKASLAKYFNHKIQLDIFFILGGEFIMIVDELFRYKQAELIKDRSFDTMSATLLESWFRFFGPPRYVTIDQEGALAGAQFAMVCDKFGITRIVAGSDPTHVGQGKHTKTGLAEKHVDLVKLTMLKIHADCREQSIDISLRDLGREASMAHNLLLTFNGITPATGVFGVTPREYFDLDNTTLDAGDSGDTALHHDRAVKQRMIAKAAALQTVAEHRLAHASRTKPHQIKESSFSVGCLIDLYKAPTTKDSPGWRGPAVLLDMDSKEGTCVVK